MENQKELIIKDVNIIEYQSLDHCNLYTISLLLNNDQKIIILLLKKDNKYHLINTDIYSKDN